MSELPPHEDRILSAEEELQARLMRPDRHILKSIEAIERLNEPPDAIWRGDITIGKLKSALLAEKERRGL